MDGWINKYNAYYYNNPSINPVWFTLIQKQMVLIFPVIFMIKVKKILFMFDFVTIQLVAEF